MPRFGEVAPEPVEALKPYLQPGVVDTIASVCESLNQFDPLAFGIVPHVLSDEGLALLEQLEVPVNAKCPIDTLLAHPVARPLAETMGKISLANVDLRSRSSETIFSLKNETGEGVLVEPHRDLLDGHAVLFNYCVTGNLFYVLDDVRYPIKNNEMIILNGAAVWGNITKYLPGKEYITPGDSLEFLGGVTIAHAVESDGPSSRNRLLSYANGRDTLVTQIPAQLPYWF